MLLSSHLLNPSNQPKIEVQNTNAVLRTLDQYSIAILVDRLAAIPGRLNSVLFNAAKLCAPDIQVVKVPSRTIQTEADIRAWISEVEKDLTAALLKGPIVIQ